MTLSRTVLSNALAFVPRYSFTRQALVAANPQAAQRPDLLESLFGTGEEPARNLVREWEEQGLGAMAGREGEGKAVVLRGKAQREVDFEAVKGALGRRIRWSSGVGEHLVQAHALLATPEKQLSAQLPRPVTKLAEIIGTKLRLDPAYIPPPEYPSSSAQVSSPQTSPSVLSNLTIPLVNPLPLLSYALKIADEALYVSGAEPETRSGELDWYTRRLGLAMIYLHAETHLLHPRPANASADPQLPRALHQLDVSMARYQRISEAGGRLADVEREVAQFGWFVWKSWGGLFRSRGWIN